METYLDNYVGEWDDECGWQLSITRVNDKTFSVSLLANRQPITRPWYGDQPSMEMIGKYDEELGLVVELWEKGKGFSLHLNFEPEFELDEENRDALSVGLPDTKKTIFLTSTTLCLDR